jgi:hypothetical protein
MSVEQFASKLTLHLRTEMASYASESPLIYEYPAEMLANVNYNKVYSNGDYVLVKSISSQRYQNILMDYNIAIRVRCTNIDSITMAQFEIMCQGIEKIMRYLRQYELSDEFFVANTTSINGIRIDAYENEYRAEMLYRCEVDIAGIPGEEHVQ